MDSHHRSVAKAVSYRVFATLITCLLAWLLTADVTKGLQIGLIDGVTKLFGYFLHERVWARIGFGAPKPPDYEI